MWTMQIELSINLASIIVRCFRNYAYDSNSAQYTVGILKINYSIFFFFFWDTFLASVSTVIAAKPGASKPPPLVCSDANRSSGPRWKCYPKISCNQIRCIKINWRVKMVIIFLRKGGFFCPILYSRIRICRCQKFFLQKKAYKLFCFIGFFFSNFVTKCTI